MEGRAWSKENHRNRGNGRLSETQYVNISLALSDDSELGGIARRFLRQNEFFENDKAKLYFLRKKRKDEVKICTETTLSMANERLGVTNEIAHQNSLDRLKEIAEKESLSDEGDYEEPGDEDKPSKENPRQVFLSKSRVATPKPCYFDGLPIHAGYSLMAEDWITDGVNLSNNLKGTGLVSKLRSLQLSDTGCTLQISDEHWEMSWSRFLMQHKLKNALSTENKLVKIVREENKKKLLEQGNLKLMISLCDSEEDTTKVLEIGKRIRLVLFLKEFADFQILKSLDEMGNIYPFRHLDKQIVQWQDGKEMKQSRVKTQLTSRLLVPIIQ
ncbi:unnamed protein product [Rhizophagus irregularis]|uniref:Uncharacterized protein n=1 Tax=Rhizophagus irregularis TaxID=588596 RepID=A0A915YYV6_9GLOM|nr:unnamed protein product [Rhizophagus irregularis]